jgi:hypothetical protein
MIEITGQAINSNGGIDAADRWKVEAMEGHGEGGDLGVKNPGKSGDSMHFGCDKPVKFQSVSISDRLKGEESACSGRNRLRHNFPGESYGSWPNKFGKGKGINEVIEFLETMGRVINFHTEEF